MTTTQKLSEDKLSIIRNAILAFVLIFIFALVSQTLGLGRTGFDSSLVLEQYFFYVGPGTAFLIGILLVWVVERAITKGDAKYGSSVSFNSPGESPGLLQFKWVKNPVQLTWISILFFGFIGMLTSFTKQSFTGVGVLAQQFTVLDNLLYSSALVPAAENLGAAFAWAFVLFIWRSVARRYNVNSISFKIVSTILSIAVYLLYGLFNHLLRYGASDVDLQTVLIFWAVGGLFTILTNSFIPFWIMHISNNLFFTLAKAFSNESIGIATGAVLVVLLLLYIVAYARRKNTKSRTTRASRSSRRSRK